MFEACCASLRGLGFTNARLRHSGPHFAMVAAGLAFLLTFEFLRAWAVSMPLFYDGFLRAPRPLLGLLAFSPFIVAFVAASILAWLRSPGGVLVLVVASMRVALQFVGPGLPRLAVIMVGLAACLSLLVALAPRRETIVALVGALAADATFLMLLETESLVFRNGVAAAGGACALSSALVLSHYLGDRRASAESRMRFSRLSAPRDALLPWLGFGPALALHLTIASLPAPVEVVTGWDADVAQVLIAGSYLIGAALAWWGWGRAERRQSARLLPALTAAIVLVCTFVALFAASSRWSVVAAVLLPIGLLGGLAFLARLPGWTSELPVRFASAGALTVGVGAPFLFYLGFVFRYPLSPPWLLAATACILAGLLALLSIFNRPADELSPLQGLGGRRAAGSIGGAQMGPAPRVRPHLELPALGRAGIRPRWLVGIGIALITFLLAAPAIGGDPSRDSSALRGFPVRVASYNIFMGLGADVNMDIDRLAAQIASQVPDVVALQEVSRGWFTSGSVDLLPRIADRLGYSYRFFPAADQTWGNAILTNLPSADYAHGFLPQGIAAMRRGWGGEVLELGDDQRMLFVVTHLYNPPDGHELRAQQAEWLVERILTLAERYHLVDMTVVVGDLNAESDSQELASLREAYTDVFGYLGTLPMPTYPSWAPEKRIDHIFVSDGLRGFDLATFGGLASDHLGLAVTLRPVGPDQASGEVSGPYGDVSGP